MKENKEINRVDGTGQKKAGKKLPYEKPMAAAIALFADQVLSSCGKLPTEPAPACTLQGQFS